MGLDLQTYRGRIGTFAASHFSQTLSVCVLVNFYGTLRTLGAVLFIGLLLIMSGVETNPGPTLVTKDQGSLTNEVSLENMSGTQKPRSLQLEQKLKEYQLDEKFWSKVFLEKLGIDKPEQLKFVDPHSFEKLKKLIRFDWEVNALQSMLNICDDKYTCFRQNQRDDIVKQQESIKTVLSNLEKLRNESNRTDGCVKTEEEKLRHLLAVPDDAWINQLKHKSLETVLNDVKSQFGDTGLLSSKSHELSDKELIGSASGGTVLRGVLVTKNNEDILELRKSVIDAPFDVRLRSPVIQPKDETIDITSRVKSDSFHRSIDIIGYSASASVHGSGWGFAADACFSAKHSDSEKSDLESHQEQNFHSRIKFSIIPMASCELNIRSFKIKKDVLKELNQLELLINSTTNRDIIQSKFEDFFKSYGSHVNTGTVHFGGIFEWVATYDCAFSSNKQSVKSMVQDALSAFVSIGYTGSPFSVGGSISADHIKSNTKLSASYTESELSKTNLRIVKSGGPQEATILHIWKQGLVANNSSWSVIDRGFLSPKNFKGIWELLRNHQEEFCNHIHLSGEMKSAWEKMTGISMPDNIQSDIIVKNVESMESLMSQLNDWCEDPGLVDSGVQYLTTISEKVNQLIESTGSEKIWVDQLMTKSILTDFFLKTIKMSSSSQYTNSILIKYHIRRLITMAGEQNFPKKDIIMQLIMPSEDSQKFHSVLTCQSFCTIEDLLKSIEHNFLPYLIIEVCKVNSEKQLFELDSHITVELAIAVNRLITKLNMESKTMDIWFSVAMLLPLCYNHETLQFDELVTTSKLEHLLKEAKKQLLDFQTYSLKSKVEQQAFIVEIVLTSLKKDDIYKSEASFTRVINMMGSSLLPELNDITNRYGTTKPFDFESLLTCVKQLKQGNKKFTLNKILPLESLQNALSEKQQKVERSFKMDDPITQSLHHDMLTTLGLSTWFPGKITIHDVMAVTREKDKSEIQITDLPWLILRRLIMIDFQARESDMEEYISRAEYNNGMDEDNELSCGSFYALLTSFENDSRKTDTRLNPLDVFLLLFCCCDPMMKQMLVNKMFLCKLAVPFLYPFMSKENVICSMWPLRMVLLESIDSQQETTEVSVLDHPSKRVSFIRLGRPSWSKSKLINGVLSNNSHQTFFNKDSSLGSSERQLCHGLVEASWYIPSGKASDFSSEIIAFLNLRGNALDMDAQMDIIKQISHTIVVMVDVESLEQDDCIKLMKDLHQNPCPVVMLISQMNQGINQSTIKSKMETYARKVGDSIEQTQYIMTIKGGKERNSTDVKNDIHRLVTKNLKRQTAESLNACCQKSAFSSVFCDESHPKCIAGMNFAQTILDHISEVSVFEVKDLVTPLQSKLWQTLSYKQKNKKKGGKKKTVYDQDVVQKEIISIRKKQLEICNNLSPVMTAFISHLVRHVDDEELILFSMQCLKMKLEHNLRTHLPDLTKKFRTHWRNLKSSKDKQDYSNITELENLVATSRKEIADASFGLEHLIRELGQIYETVMFQGGSKASKEILSKVKILPMVVAKLLTLGIPFEIMDGDAANVPIMWVEAVLNSLKSLLGDKTLFSLSVLGIQSSGKSTLLNTMFGLQFAVSAGRCTRGVFVQLVKVDDNCNFPFKYILVIDTEGLRAPELSSENFYHDNELATLVIGMGDVTIINVKGENTAEVKDVLQTAVHAFLRLKLVNERLNLRQSCVFIHQNVPAVNAKDKMLQGRQNLVENLDDMTLEAAAQELITNICAFDQVINFNSEKHVWYFSDLWNGDPPMAPANPGYSEKVLEVKRCILEDISYKRNTFLTISNTLQHITDLWEGIMADDFVFSFRNSLEVQAYTIMESKYQELAWELERFTLDWLRKTASIEIGKCTDICGIEGCVLNLTTSLTREVVEKSETVKQNLEVFFNSHNLKDILIKWKQNKFISLINHSEDLINRFKQEIVEMKEQARLDKLQQVKQTDLMREINRKARDLADTMKGKRPSETEMKTLFNDMYIEWINQLATRFTSDPIPIEDEVESVLYTKLFKESALLTEETRTYPLNSPLNVSCLEKSLLLDNLKNLKKHVSISTYVNIDLNGDKIERIVWDKCESQALDVAKDAFRTIDAYLTDKSSTDSRFNKSFVTEILNTVVSCVDKHNTYKSKYAKFTLLPSFKVKLAVHVCRHAIQVFKSMNENYDQKHSTKARIQRYRSTAWNLFKNLVHQKTNEFIATSFFSDSIEGVIKKNLNTYLPVRVEAEILSEFTHTKYHLIVAIMDDLAKKANFALYKEYIQNPYTYSFTWLTDFTNKKIFCKSSGKSRYAEIARIRLEAIMSSIQRSATAATAKVKDHMGMKTEKWITEFEQEIRKEKINIQDGTFSHMNDIEVHDFSNFNELVFRRLIDLEESINEFYNSVSASSVNWEVKTPYQNMMNKLWGCDAKCPFCHEPCQNTNADHIETGQSHTCIQHRPSGIGGDRWDGQSRKDKLCVESCNFFIQSQDTEFNCRDCGLECRQSGKCNVVGDDLVYHNAVDYKTVLPDWDIAPSQDMYSKSEYWMWFMATFRCQLKDMHAAQLPDIPETWFNITLDSALKSIRRWAN